MAFPVQTRLSNNKNTLESSPDSLGMTLKGSASAKEKATGKAFYHPKSTAEVSNKYHLELSCRPAAFPFRCKIYLTYHTAAAYLGRLPARHEADHLHLQKTLAAYKCHKQEEVGTN